MRRLLASVASLALLPAAASATTYYVSSSTDNGYTTGNDTNACTTLGAPCLTTNHAETLAATGGVDTIQVNPGVAGADIYTEATGGNSLNIVKTGLLTGDPTQCALANYPTIRSTSATRVILFSTAAFPQTMACFVIDSGSTSGRSGVQPATNQLLTLRQVAFKNLAGTGQFMSGPTGASAFVLDRATTDASDTTTANPWGIDTDTHSSSLTVKGGSFAANVGMTFGQFSFSNPTLASVIFQADLNGALPSFPGTGVYGIRSGSGSIATFQAAVSVNGPQNGIYITTTAITTLRISNGAYFGGASCSGVIICNGQNILIAGVVNNGGLIQNNTFADYTQDIYIGDEGLTNFTVSGNSFHKLANGSNPTWIPQDAVSVGAGAGLIVTNNTWSVDSGATRVQFYGGGDGWVTDSSNAGGATGTASLNDTSSDANWAQAWTTLALGQLSRAPYVADIDLNLSKQGSPTGNITLCIEAPSAGSPSGTCLATSLPVTAASLTGSSLSYHFIFSPPFAVTAGTIYWEVVADSGAIDASNYVKIDRNASTAQGAFKSFNGATWTLDASHGLLNTVQTGFYGSDQTYSYNTFTYANSTDARENEAINSGPVRSIKAFGNKCWNGYICVGAKDTVNASYIFGNVSTNYGGGSGLCGFFAKASNLVTIADNTADLRGSTGCAALNSTDDGTGANPLAATNTTFKNNILRTTALNFPFNVFTDSLATLVSDRNDVAMDGTIANEKTSQLWGAWQSAGRDGTSTRCYPGLPNQTAPATVADITPRTNSCVINAGLNLKSLGLTDVNGVAFPAAPTLGAVEVMGSRVSGMIPAIGR